MNKKISLSLTVSLIVITSAITFILTYFFSLQSFSKKTEKYNSLQAVDSYVRENFYGDIDEKNISDGILKGYISGLNDRYSRYLTADEFVDEQSENAGEMTGLGFTLEENENGYIRIAEIMPDSPVSETDIKPDDFIVAVNGADVLEMGFDKAIESMSGTDVDKITVTVRRDEDDRNYTLTRRHIEVVTVTGEMLDNYVGYIKISGFKQNTSQQFIDLFEQFKSDGAKGFIFDVRENGGGLLTSLEKCLDPLLPEGVIATAEYSDGHTETIVNSDETETNLPIVVLVNGHTASAAELFAASLKDFGKAELVGSQTYGKGVMQTTTELSNGGAVVLTIAEYKTSVSECYDGVGLTPDYKVENENDDTDEQYNKAVEIINDKIN
ncbi:MAG: S41 family peptidase [Ruminococcus sp.]|nr:S41 family peptidase [Ruminococcus sp.]MDE7139063.1 S41 family peptidase [Ruminococcus sp.]